MNTELKIVHDDRRDSYDILISEAYHNISNMHVDNAVRLIAFADDIVRCLSHGWPSEYGILEELTESINRYKSLRGINLSLAGSV